MLTQNFILEQENDVLRHTIREQKIRIHQLEEQLKKYKETEKK